MPDEAPDLRAMARRLLVHPRYAAGCLGGGLGLLIVGAALVASGFQPAIFGLLALAVGFVLALIGRVSVT